MKNFSRLLRCCTSALLVSATLGAPRRASAQEGAAAPAASTSAPLAASPNAPLAAPPSTPPAAPPPVAPPAVPPPPPAAVRTAEHNEDAALVFIGDDGGLNLQAVRAIRGIAIDELRKRGVRVIDDPRSEGTMSPAATQHLMAQLHAGRAFSINVRGRLGDKVPLEFEESAAGSPAPIFSTSLTATSLEECDVVVPRLVDAVLDRKAAEDNAGIASVTRAESRPYRKKPGELLWSFGLAIPTFSGNDSSGAPFGLTTQVEYEMEHVNFGFEGVFANNRGLLAGGLFMQANWLMLDGEVTPYLGGGFGYMGADEGSGLGAKVQVGVEAFRLHSVRLIGGFEVMIPFFATSGGNGGTDVHALPMFFLQFAL